MRRTWLVALAILTASAAARADTTQDREEARRLFREAVAREDSGDREGALELYQQARARAVSPQLLFNIAGCEEALGRLLRARTTYREAADEAKTRGNDEVLREATARLARLAETIPRVRVRLPASPPQVTVEVDGNAVTIDEAPLLVDPGEHEIFARAEDGATFELAFVASAGEERAVDVVFARTTSEPGPVVRSETKPLPAPAAPSYLPAAIAGGAALAFAAVSGATFAAGRAKKDRFEELNQTPTLANEPHREELRSDGEAFYVTSTIFGASALLAGGAAVFLFVRAARTKASTSLAPTWGGFVLRGTL